MSEPTAIFLRTIDELIASQSLCHLYVWLEEPDKFSTAWIHARSEYYAVASIFDYDGTFEGIRCIRLEDIHRISYATRLTEALESIPTLERGIAAKLAVPFMNSPDFEGFSQVLTKSREVCEVMMDEMDEIVGRILEADEWSILLDRYEPNDLEFDGRTLINMEQVRYLWAYTKRTRSMPESE